MGGALIGAATVCRPAMAGRPASRAPQARAITGRPGTASAAPTAGSPWQAARCGRCQRACTQGVARAPRWPARPARCRRAGRGRRARLWWPAAAYVARRRAHRAQHPPSRRRSFRSRQHHRHQRRPGSPRPPAPSSPAARSPTPTTSRSSSSATPGSTAISGSASKSAMSAGPRRPRPGSSGPTKAAVTCLGCRSNLTRVLGPDRHAPVWGAPPANRGGSASSAISPTCTDAVDRRARACKHADHREGLVGMLAAGHATAPWLSVRRVPGW